MRFRTEIEPVNSSFAISHDDGIVLLGSCFSDNVGQRLARDGFDATFNPMGPLYNPVSLARLIVNVITGKSYGAADFLLDDNGIYHALDFASRYQGSDADELAATINRDLESLRVSFDKASTIIVTFGSSIVYSPDERALNAVGNCHKLPASTFRRLPLTVEEITGIWTGILDMLAARSKQTVMTVSPIRHLADGLHGNQLSKARLLLACDRLSCKADYFPAYEMMLDDLRDYRFYAADMKHPSEVAADYIYEKFASAYFSPATMTEAKRRRDEASRAAHRQIIT